MDTIIFSAIALGVIGASVVGLARYAERWRAEDPIARKDAVPPVFQQIGKAFMWFLLAALAVSALIAIAGPYEDCVLQNMKGVQAQAAAGAIMRACKEKTTPKKCREEALRSAIVGQDYWDGRDLKAARAAGYTDEDLLAAAPKYCLEACAAAGYWSRTFGECRTD